MSRSLLTKLATRPATSLESHGERVAPAAGEFTQFLGDEVSGLRTALQEPALEGRFQAALEAFEDALHTADQAVGSDDLEQVSASVTRVASTLTDISAEIQTDEVLPAMESALVATETPTTKEQRSKIRERMMAWVKRIGEFLRKMFDRIAQWLRDFYAKQMKPRIAKLKSSAGAAKKSIELDNALIFALGLGSGDVEDKRWHDVRAIKQILKWFETSFSGFFENFQASVKAGTSVDGTVSAVTARVYFDLPNSRYLYDQAGYTQVEKFDIKVPAINAQNLKYNDETTEVNLLRVVAGLEAHVNLTSVSNGEFFRVFTTAKRIETDFERGLQSIQNYIDKLHEKNIRESAAAVQHIAMVFQQSCLLWTTIQSRILQQVERQHKGAMADR